MYKLPLSCNGSACAYMSQDVTWIWHITRNSVWHMGPERRILYKIEFVGVCLCAVCCLFLVYDHSFEQICTKFGVWHPYTLQMIMGEGELASTT